MLGDRIEQALNKQINAEYYSAFTYLALAAHFEAIDLRGFAHWMRVQYEEELMHAMKIYDFINERDGKVVLHAVEEPRLEFGPPLEAFEYALQGERRLSGKIYELVDLALEERDHATHAFLQWFVGEQVEEEALVNEIVQDLKRVGHSGEGLFLMDRDLAGRQSTQGEAGAQE